MTSFTFTNATMNFVDDIEEELYDSNTFIGDICWILMMMMNVMCVTIKVKS
jgi:hypothetical protein